MNIQDFEKFSTRRSIISDDELEPRGRTLLYGYTQNRFTFHLYFSFRQFYTFIYKENEDRFYRHGFELNLNDRRLVIPDKRLYPEACDLQFCLLLRDAGIELTFTMFNENREEESFYGRIHTDESV